MEARYDGLQWGTTEETTGLNCLSNFDPTFYQNANTKPKWIADTNEVLACGMLKALMDAHRMVWCAQLRYDLRTGNITAEQAPSFAELVSGVPNPIGSSETRDKVREFAQGDAVLADIPALYDVVLFEVLQAVRSSRPIKEPKPMAGLSSIQADLGALPAVAIVALGVAAIAGATYMGTEITKDVAKSWSALESEKAWAVNRAWAEVEVAKQAIAAGQPYQMSDWARMRAAVASASQTSWAPLALGAVLAAVVGASAYLLREKHAAHRSNPSHFVPRRRRLRRKNPSNPTRNRRPRGSYYYRVVAQHSGKDAGLLGTASTKEEAERIQAKHPHTTSRIRRYRNNPKRNPPLPRKKKSARKDARKKSARPSGKFMRSQRAKGRTDAQARAAWKLKKRAQKGKRGKR